MRIANFVSTTENGIRIQLYAALIHYLLTHLLILQAMQATGRPFEEFSVPYCLEAVQQVLHSTSTLVQKGAAPHWEQIEQQLLQLIITHGLRPNRKREPLIGAVRTRLAPKTSVPSGP